MIGDGDDDARLEAAARAEVTVELNIEGKHGDHGDQHFCDDAQDDVVIGVHEGSSSLAAEALRVL
jgi:hypothetical protein